MSARGSAGPARGFSLVEMLVVLFVVVLLTGVVSLSVDSGARDRIVRERVEALAAVATYALDEAQFVGSDFGVLFTRGLNDAGEDVTRAHWRQRLPEGWRAPPAPGELFAPIEFPGDVELELVLDGAPVALDEARAADAGRAPQWLLLSSGETQAGELSVRERLAGELLWRLGWDALARFDSRSGARPSNFADRSGRG